LFIFNIKKPNFRLKKLGLYIVNKDVKAAFIKVKKPEFKKEDVLYILISYFKTNNLCFNNIRLLKNPRIFKEKYLDFSNLESKLFFLENDIKKDKNNNKNVLLNPFQKAEKVNKKTKTVS
jgi:hypothetical protein